MRKNNTFVFTVPLLVVLIIGFIIPREEADAFGYEYTQTDIGESGETDEKRLNFAEIIENNPVLYRNMLMEPMFHAVSTIAYKDIAEEICESVLESYEEHLAEQVYKQEDSECEYVDRGYDSTYLGQFRLTAYCSCERCCGVYAQNRPVDENGRQIVLTASGAKAIAGVTIAVDPGVIPFGAEVMINGHVYTAQDTGGGIVGNRIDIYFDDHQEALDFGVQYADVEVVRW